MSVTIEATVKDVVESAAVTNTLILSSESTVNHPGTDSGLVATIEYVRKHPKKSCLKPTNYVTPQRALYQSRMASFSMYREYQNRRHLKRLSRHGGSQRTWSDAEVSRSLATPLPFPLMTHPNSKICEWVKNDKPIPAGTYLCPSPSIIVASPHIGGVSSKRDSHITTERIQKQVRFGSQTVHYFDDINPEHRRSNAVYGRRITTAATNEDRYLELGYHDGIAQEDAVSTQLRVGETELKAPVVVGAAQSKVKNTEAEAVEEAPEPNNRISDQTTIDGDQSGGHTDQTRRSISTFLASLGVSRRFRLRRTNNSTTKAKPETAMM